MIKILFFQVCSVLLTVLSIILLCYISTDVSDHSNTFVAYDTLTVKNDPGKERKPFLGVYRVFHDFTA